MLNYLAPPRMKAVLMLALALTGCAGSEALRQDVAQAANETRKGSAEPFLSVTNFSKAVRCMDAMFIDYGVRDVGVVVEDLTDETKRLSFGTRDMLLGTLSDMTRRSRALRVVAYGRDSNNVIGFLQQADRKEAYAKVPQFDIRGSITQYDENVASATKEAGVAIGDFLNARKNGSASARILGMDLTVVNTSDLSLVPGVTSKNAVVLSAQSDGNVIDAKYAKLGVNYSTSFSKSEGNSVAVRNLIELAAVELVGKLTKVPYWKCLGASDQDPSIQDLVNDWHWGMTYNMRELFTYHQAQLSVRGFYKGPVNGIPSPAFIKAIRDYRVALGLEPTSDLDAKFLMAYLSADNAAIAAKAEAERARTPAAPAPAVTAPKPVKPTAKPASKASRGRAGQNAQGEATQ